MARTTSVSPSAAPRSRRRAAAALLLPLLLAGGLLPLVVPGADPAAAAPVEAAAVAPDDCGEAPPNPELWECSFVDTFDGSSLDRAKWDVLRSDRTGFTNGPECYFDRPENISVANGTLRLTAREEASTFTCNDHRGGSFQTKYTGASVLSLGRFSQTYGRFEFRAKVPAPNIPGLHEAFWLWPDDAWKYGPWPYTPEIDVAEGYSKYSDRMIPFIHYAPNTWDPNVTNNYCVIPNLGTEFHSFVLEWTPERLKVLYDGKVCIDMPIQPANGTLVAPAPFDHPYFMAMNQSLGVAGTANAFLPGTTPLPATTEVDHVKVWRYVGDGSGTTTTTVPPTTTTTVAPTTTTTAPPKTVPAAPTAATLVPSGLTGAVSFTPGADGGSPVTSYTATCTSSDKGTTRSGTAAGPPVTVTSLSAGKTYSCKVRATNAVGTGPWSAASPSVRLPTAPATPTSVKVSASPSAATVSFTPGSNGGSPVSAYTASCTSTNGGASRTGSAVSSPVTVSSLSAGKTYTCRVQATNAVGTSAWSAKSSSFKVPVATAPAAPTEVMTASWGPNALVAFTPGDDGGSPVTTYTVLCLSTDWTDAKWGLGTDPLVAVLGLVVGKTYACAAWATNAVGVSPASAASALFTTRW